MNWFYAPINYGMTPVQMPPAKPGADITFYPRALGPGYGYFSYAEKHGGAPQKFLCDNNVAGHGRTEADDLALCEKASAAGFAVEIIIKLGV